jgi:hypothetical protein
MFDSCEPARIDHATDIQEATDFLIERTIPEFAKSLEEYLFTDQVDADELIDLIHRAGINVRYCQLSFFGNTQTFSLNLKKLLIN